MTIENIRLGSNQILVADLALKLPLYLTLEGMHPRRIELRHGTVLHDLCLWAVQDHLDKAQAAKAQASKDPAPSDPVNLADVEIDQRVTVSIEPCVRDFIRNLEEMVVRVVTGYMEDREKRGA